MFGLARPKVVAFDIIDTTFQIEALDPRLVALGLPAGTVRRLYAEALRDAMALACANRFAPFMDVMKGGVASLLAESGDTASDREITQALSVMRELPPHPDAPDAFARLAGAGIRVFALSNGAEAATRSLLDRAGMTGSVEEVLSVESVKLSKPRPEVYLYAVETAKVKPEDVMLVACHPWDVQGAKAAGLIGGYVARGKPYPAPMKAPDLEADSLSAIAHRIVALSG